MCYRGKQNKRFKETEKKNNQTDHVGRTFPKQRKFDVGVVTRLKHLTGVNEVQTVKHRTYNILGPGLARRSPFPCPPGYGRRRCLRAEPIRVPVSTQRLYAPTRSGVQTRLLFRWPGNSGVNLDDDDDSTPCSGDLSDLVGYYFRSLFLFMIGTPINNTSH